MSTPSTLPDPGLGAPAPKSINIAVLALGGQGGGVLVDWIVNLAESAGWTAQSTSVAGVAQRTGTTIYYVELVAPTPGREPVMALVPVPGEVDILIAAELMEAGRAVERGLITAARTTVIASSHRTYAIAEKSSPGNGVADSLAVMAILQVHAKRLISGDLQVLAARCGSVISSSLFGALAGSGALPFSLSAFEAVVERSGVGVSASMKSLREAAQLAQAQSSAQANSAPAPTLPLDAMLTPARALPERAASAAMQTLVDRVRQQFPAAAWPWLGEGLARVVDWQDAAYGSEYLDRVQAFAALDTTEQGHRLTIEAARWIAVAMSYDDVMRVADLKTRAERFVRIRSEIDAQQDDVLGTEEYLHPRLEEIMGLLPVRWARWLEASPKLRAALAKRFTQGQRIATHSVRGHLQLRAVASLRRWRRGNQRHAHETAHLGTWLQTALALQSQDYALAVEVLRSRRLVKGYSDTHARGASKFDRLLAASKRLQGQPEAAQQLAQWTALALREVSPEKLYQEIFSKLDRKP